MVAPLALRPLSDLLALCYHALSPGWPAALSTTPERFAEQLHDLRRRGYEGVRLSDLATRPPSGKAVAITFDDGYRSVDTLARPILDEVGWPATLYVPTDWIGRDEPMTWPGIDDWLGGPHEQELLPLGWDDVRRLRDSGWEIGSHTCSHPRLTEIGDEELARELVTSREICERELGACESIAYPYGDVDQRVVAAAAVAGYRTGAALPVRPHAARPLEWPRTGVYNVDDLRRFRLKASRLVRFVRQRRG